MSTTTVPSSVHAAALFERAVKQHLAGNRTIAIDLYKRVLAAEPRFAEACNNLGTLLAQQARGRGAENQAFGLFLRAIEVQPEYGEAHNNVGLVLVARGDHEGAVDHFARAVATDATKGNWLNNFANALVELFRFDEALEVYDRAVRVEPMNFEFWSNRALALRGLRRADDAIASLRRALTINPRHASALSNIGTIFKEEKRFDEASAAFERAVEVEPDNAAIWANYAAIFEPQMRFDRMRELAQRGVDLDPTYPESYNLLANSEMERGRYAEALALYQKAIALDPENRNANWNLALIWLLHGDFENGWKQFEWRNRLQSVVVEHLSFQGRAWDGEAIDGRTMLLHTEQGMGDAIQFIRYAPLLKARGAGRLIVEAPYPILPLLAGVDGVDQVIARGLPLPAYDVHVNLMSLPRLMGTTLATVPARVPYMAVTPSPAAALVSAPPGTLKVGIVWAGNPLHARDLIRSVALSQLAPVLGTPGIAFFSLQKGTAAEEQLRALPLGMVTDLAPQLDDFRDTAAVISRLDLVISIDTSVAHLAGALGVPTWLLLPHVPDFRWMLEREDSPWYPTMRLFRQPEPGAWIPVLEQLASALAMAVVPETRDAALGRLGAECSVIDTAVPDDEAVTTLRSAMLLPDGRPRFDMWVPLKSLANDALFAQYERELVGDGHERAVRVFLDELLRTGDAFIDIAPGLGLVTMSVATAPAPPATIHVVDGDARGLGRLARLARAQRVSPSLETFATIGDAIAAMAHSPAMRNVLRVGDPSAAPELFAAIEKAGVLARTDAIIWPSCAPATLADALSWLGARDYTHLTLSLSDGGSSLDPIDDIEQPQDIVSFSPSLLRALEMEHGSAVEPCSAVPGIGGASRTAIRQLGIDWELRSDTGWGVYGVNLSLALKGRGDVAPVVFAADTSDLAPQARFVLGDVLREGAARGAALEGAPTAVATFDGTMLRALGNNLTHGALWDRVRARRNVGVIFSEDTYFDHDALDRARTLDRIVAGSTWNGDVLRALGLDHVRVVLQGVDPTIFHPAPSSGQFGNRFVVFSGGKLEFRKGQDLVAAAFRAFRARHPEALLITSWHNGWPRLISDMSLAGHMRTAPEHDGGSLQITRWLAENGVPSASVLDIGRVPNALMGQVMREADVALFANRCEGGTNLVAMECMACGIPTIVSANTGHLDLIATGGTIPLMRQDAVPRPTRFFRGTEGWGESSVDEMVEALERIYTDRAAAHATAALGAEALSRMSWKAQADLLMIAVEDLL